MTNVYRILRQKIVYFESCFLEKTNRYTQRSQNHSNLRKTLPEGEKMILKFSQYSVQIDLWNNDNQLLMFHLKICIEKSGEQRCLFFREQSSFKNCLSSFSRSVIFINEEFQFVCPICYYIRSSVSNVKLTLKCVLFRKRF